MTPSEALQALTEHLPGNPDLDDPVRARQREAADVLAKHVDSTLGQPEPVEFVVLSIAAAHNEVAASDFWMTPPPGRWSAVVTAESANGETIEFRDRFNEPSRVGDIVTASLARGQQEV